MTIDGQQYMDRDELASSLGVLPSTISSWMSRGKMPQAARYVGRSPLWLVTDIEVWKAKRPGKGWRGK